MECKNCKYYFGEVVTAEGMLPYCENMVIHEDEFYCQADNMIYPLELAVSEECKVFELKQEENKTPHCMRTF